MQKKIVFLINGTGTIGQLYATKKCEFITHTLYKIELSMDPGTKWCKI